MNRPYPTAEEERELVRRARAGEYSAFEKLVTAHERRLYGLAMNIVRRREDAEDAVQTSFLKALEHLADFREESSFATWITQIVVNEALKMLRKRRGLPVREPLGPKQADDDEEEGDIAHPEYIADWREEPGALAERKEVRRILEEAIDRLPEGHRLVFVLRDLAGKSVEETAQALGLSKANVKVRLLRARLALREELTRAFGDEARRVVRTHRHEGDERGATPAAELLRAYREKEARL
ncbi:MAG: sigma-70 family RNA polymerase sigma factor [Planctomycetota bacterium]